MDDHIETVQGNPPYTPKDSPIEDHLEEQNYKQVEGLDYIDLDITYPESSTDPLDPNEKDLSHLDPNENNFSGEEESVCSAKSARSVSFDIPAQQADLAMERGEDSISPDLKAAHAHSSLEKGDSHNEEELEESEKVTHDESEKQGECVNSEDHIKSKRSRTAHELVRGQERLLGDLCSLKRDLVRVDDELKSLKKHLTFNMSYGLYGNQSFYSRGQHVGNGTSMGAMAKAGDHGGKIGSTDLEMETAVYLNSTYSKSLPRSKSMTKLWTDSDWDEGRTEYVDRAPRKPVRNYYALNSEGNVEYRPLGRTDRSFNGEDYLSSTPRDYGIGTDRTSRSTLRSYGSSPRSLSARSRARSTSPPRLSGLSTSNNLSYGTRFVSTDNLHNLHSEDYPSLSSTSHVPRYYHKSQYKGDDHRSSYRCGACGTDRFEIPRRDYDYNHDFGSQTLSRIYVKALGLPKPNGRRHAAEIAALALELLDIISNLEIPHMPGANFRIRIGCHTGQVVAGIVGVKMPRYCLFGETVIIASRMECTGKLGRIHISETTYNILKEIGGYVMHERQDLKAEVAQGLAPYGTFPGPDHKLNKYNALLSQLRSMKTYWLVHEEGKKRIGTTFMDNGLMEEPEEPAVELAQSNKRSRRTRIVSNKVSEKRTAQKEAKKEAEQEQAKQQASQEARPEEPKQ